MRELPPYQELHQPAQQPGNFSSILGKIPKIFSELVFCLDRNGVITDCLAGDSVAYHAATEDFLGQHLIKVLPSTVSMQVLAAVTTTAQTGRVSTLKYELTIGAELRWHSANCIRVNDASLIVIIHDITDHKRAQEAAQQETRLMAVLREFTREFLKAQDIRTLGAQITRLCVDEVGLQAAWLGLIKPGDELQELACAQMDGAPDDLARYIQPQPDEVKTLIGVKTHLILKSEASQLAWKPIRAFFPLFLDEKVIGILSLIVENLDFFTPETINFFHTCSTLIAMNLQKPG